MHPGTGQVTCEHTPSRACAASARRHSSSTPSAPVNVEMLHLVNVEMLGVDMHCTSHTKVGAITMASSGGHIAAVRLLDELGCHVLHRDSKSCFWAMVHAWPLYWPSSAVPLATSFPFLVSPRPLPSPHFPPFICPLPTAVLRLPACLPVCLPCCLPICLSACLPVCLSVCLPACLSIPPRSFYSTPCFSRSQSHSLPHSQTHPSCPVRSVHISSNHPRLSAADLLLLFSQS